VLQQGQEGDGDAQGNLQGLIDDLADVDDDDGR
jgi:hypothetical protein